MPFFGYILTIWDGYGSGLNRDLPCPTPIRGGFGSKLVEFEVGLGSGVSNPPCFVCFNLYFIL